MKRIVLTGGGTAGHVMPNLALLPELRKRGWEVLYVGSYDGMERALIEDQQIPYYPVATGKFRRYLSAQNLTDPFRVVKEWSSPTAYCKISGPKWSSPKGVLSRFR